MLFQGVSIFQNSISLIVAVIFGVWYAPSICAQAPANAVSPVLQINHPSLRGREELTAPTFRERSAPLSPIRAIDGSANNPTDPELGATFTQLRRLVEPDYTDGISDMAKPNRPGPRVISNIVSAQQGAKPDPLRASDYLWQWGQFLDHDIDLTDGVDPNEPADIEIPVGDPFFDPQGAGNAFLPFNRSIYDNTTGLRPSNPRQQLNEITTWIDASNVYGSDAARAAALRSNDGTGRMKMSDGNLLPFNTDGFPNAGGAAESLFLAGDVRANEQVGLTALHTLFVREHNRLAERIAEANPGFSGEQIYQKARQIIGAQIQVITFQEFLPALLGHNAIAPYQAYNENIDPRMTNVFTTAAFRWGHSALNSKLLRLQANGQSIAAGDLALRDAFFAPHRITNEGGIEPLLRGLVSQVSQAVDPELVDDVRNFLFGEPGSGGFDLASLNIQRGRDHGLPRYNDTREELGLPRAASFSAISSDPEVRARLESTVEAVDDIDLWVGGLAEDHLPGAHVGELFFTIIKEQFEALRDGDRLWYQRTLLPEEIADIENTRLSDVIRRNTEIGNEIPNDVFHVSGRVVANFRKDFRSGNPVNGWRYLWNSIGPIGSPSDYSNLLWNGRSRYDSDGEPDWPDDSNLAWGSIHAQGGHPGPGKLDGQNVERYVIAGYRVPEAGNYLVTNSSIQHSGCSFSDGGEVRVYVNGIFVGGATYAAQGNAIFDGPLGGLVAGDTIYVAAGPKGNSGCDAFFWDFSIEITGTNGSPEFLTERN